VTADQESLELQYGLAGRARAHGRDERDVRVIDTDLGRTARTAHGRPGFQELVTPVTLEQVGIIFAHDVTRLARNCTDWYQLLDLCGFRHCLVGDQDGVYDPATPNGRLILGLTGLISELELHTPRPRPTAGLLQKAQRGDLALTLPAGRTRDPLGRVVLHPDQEVQDRLRLVFATFLRLRSATQVVRWLTTQGLPLPRRRPRGGVVWRPARPGSVLTILKNPASAGAFAYGRTRGRPAAGPEAGAGQPPPRRAQWKVCLPDRHPGSIDWATFAEVRAMPRDDCSAYDRNQSRGAPRPGKALLHGLLYCGLCGHKMVVQYENGTRYLCNRLRQRYQVPVCQDLPADPLDSHVAAAFPEALTPAELGLYDRAMAQLRAAQGQVDRAHGQRLERLRYQARLAERQYRRADPGNRLVTAELERRREAALRALPQAEAEWQRRQPQPPPAEASPAELRQALESAGRRLPGPWQGGLLSRERKKAFLRCLVEKVVAHREVPDTLHVRIVWRGGDTTAAGLPVAVGAPSRLSLGADMEGQVVRLARGGKADDGIAELLTRQGCRPPRAPVVLPNTVLAIRRRHGVLVDRRQSHPRHVAGCLTVPRLARQLGVADHWICDRIHNGLIEIARDPQSGLYLFPDRPQTLALFRQLRAGRLQKLRF
jgi:DNA invertase Pin-like site-specific DNA recombinase